ncbi:MAG: sensor histidine kinase, partial [bacterium]|nr:sensor histidine kinase [bacterium]
MPDNNAKLSSLSELRRKAEQEASIKMNSSAGEEQQSTIYELELHRVELEMQNDELERAHEEIFRLNKELEQRVKDRTIELQQANMSLNDSLKTLQRAKSQLVRSEKMAALGDLVAGVAHEVNTPMGVGITAASYLNDETTNVARLYSLGNLTRPDFNKYIEIALESSSTILSNLARTNGLIENLKQLVDNQYREELREFNLKQYTHKILESLQFSFIKNRHSININCPDDLEIKSYPGVYFRIINNLIMNSLVHGFDGVEQGEIIIDIAEDAGGIFFSYSDNGNGMDDDTMEKIFDPFHTTARGKGATGLGMYIVYNLVTQTLGGQIECTSAKG